MILLRHGQTEFNVIYGATRQDPGIEDPPLTEDGRRQAEDAARRLDGEAVRHIVVSPYRRALETAEIIAATLVSPVTVDPLVRERYAFSCDVGTPTSALMETWSHLELDHLEEIWWPQEEEPETALHERCRRFSRTMADRDDWDRCLVVTHWGVIRSLTGRRVANGDMLRYDPTTGRLIGD